MKSKSIFRIKKYGSFLGIILPLAAFLYFSGCATTGGYDNRGYDDQNSSGAYYDDQNGYADENQVLDTYGEWIAVAPYGTVWRPFVNADWQPYYYGNWIRTDRGWTWVSYEPFGWITYHYGYWDNRPGIGWFWIESNDWTPARVDWVYDGDYVGWAPMPPPGYYGQQPVQVVVDIRNFTQENVGKYRLNRVPGDFRSGRHDAPDISTVERYTNRQVRVVRSNREKVTVNGRQYDRLVLPKREAAVVREYQPQVTRDVVRSRNNAPVNNGGNNVIRTTDPTRTVDPTRNNNGTRTNNGTRNNDGTRSTRDNNTVRTRGNDNNARPENPENKVVPPSNPNNPNMRPSEPRRNNPDTRAVRPVEPKTERPSEPANPPSQPRRDARERPANQEREHQQQPAQQPQPRTQQQPQSQQNNREEERRNRSERQNRNGQQEKKDDGGGRTR